ncbi:MULTISPECIES: helix-turn-helix domain-containing protein [unclassified Streptomyces]|uniref:helix-turn-helix domain-containing protein n=1 Tax=unclassified Streptomyces TaxID=2593676 RepID=UPI000F6ED7AC|nr:MULTISPECIES: helix-turn-helix transcriptional regulator [unclassified Streptomyces]AZM60577.1 transcriptional regulator [Streptomyces sp. WAC 01438]RSM98452.1 transcriptional regulator [Streptomyces sp. WAC 01420]
MSVDGEAVRVKREADEPGWEVDPDDEWGVAVITTVGRQLKLRREAAGMRAGQFGAAIGYGEDLVYKVEGGKRIPQREYLDRADEVLRAGGLLSAAWEDVKKVRYPKSVRALAELEAKAVELGVYVGLSIHGLLQTPEHARALFDAWQPPYSEEEAESLVAARMARKSIFERCPAPALSFVLEEATLRRCVGGTMVWRRQLEHLLEVGRLRNVTLQVMPISAGAHPGLDGRIEVLKFADGTAAGRSDGAFGGRPTFHPRQLRILELRYGAIRAQALTPRESLAFIEQVLGET